MTVYELIQKLTEYNADSEIKLYDGNQGFDIEEIKSEDFWKHSTRIEQVTIIIQ